MLGCISCRILSWCRRRCPFLCCIFPLPEMIITRITHVLWGKIWSHVFNSVWWHWSFFFFFLQERQKHAMTSFDKRMWQKQWLYFHNFMFAEFTKRTNRKTINISLTWVEQSTASCCISSDISAFLITAFLSVILLASKIRDGKKYVHD